MEERGEKQFYIGLGSGIRLFHEDWFLKAFGKNLTKQGFRKLCRALHCPMIHLRDGRYVDQARFCMAMSAILSIGNPDFLCVGADTHRKPRVKARCATELDLDKFRRNYYGVVKELLHAKQLNQGKITQETKDAARKAAEYLTKVGASFIPAEAQAQYEQKVQSNRVASVHAAKNRQSAQRPQAQGS